MSLRTPELAECICGLLAAGNSLRAICRTPGMPSKSFVMEWLSEDKAFADQYARARELGIDERFEAMADEVETIEDNNRARLVFDMRRWELSKLAPKKYGDKIDHNHSGDVNMHHTVEFVDPSAKENENGLHADAPKAAPAA